MENFKGKAIYNPSGKAGEYSYWACNFYTGCSNNCNYCYCKRGVMSSTWSDKPQLKKKFKDEEHAIEVFKKEMFGNFEQLKRHGLFFTFTSDPMLDLTMDLTLEAVLQCAKNGIPVKILTKCAETVDFCFLGGILGQHQMARTLQTHSALIAIGFTLTGHDELEPGASTNAERIEVMRKLHAAGFKTFASIEPIIDVDDSLRMIKQTLKFCDLYKIGVQSGKKYPQQHLRNFIHTTRHLTQHYGNKVYFKDSLLEKAGFDRDKLPYHCVGRDYNIFTNKS